MQIILSDHNCEGQARAIFQALDRHGFLPTFPMALTFFLHVGMHPKSSDRQVWQFCQENGYLLLTGNRTVDDGKRSLEYVIRALLKEEGHQEFMELTGKSSGKVGFVNRIVWSNLPGRWLSSPRVPVEPRKIACL